MQLIHRARSEQEAAEFLAQHEGKIERIDERNGHIQIVLSPGEHDLHDEAELFSTLEEQEERQER